MEFYTRCSLAARAITENFEIILVNDGSPDNALALAEELASKDAKLRVVHLSRNFGHQAAIRVGLGKAKGEWIFLIDADLEESPEWVNDFWQLKKEGTDVVYGVQETRKGNWWERVSGSLYYSLVQSISAYPIPRNVVTARLMTRKYVESVLRYPEKDVELWVLFYHVGFVQQAVTVTKKDKGSTSFSMRHKVQLLVSTITSSTNAPLYGMFICSIFMWCLSCGCMVYYLIRPQGNAFLISVFSVGISTLCVFVGVVSVYLAKIFNEVRNRPIAIEKSGS